MEKPLISYRYFSKIFIPLIGRRIAYIALRGNVGDQMIEAGTLQLFNYYNIEYKKLTFDNFHECWDYDEIVVCGGGSMGDLYPFNRALRASLFQYKKKITILPQSYTNSTEDIPYDTIYVREKESLKHEPRGVLAPDMALALCCYINKNNKKERLGVWMREDREKLQQYENYLDSIKGLNHYTEYIARAQKYETIITDRLHFAIASLMCGNKTILLPNNYFKNRSMYECWLKDLGCSWANDLQEALKLVDI